MAKPLEEKIQAEVNKRLAALLSIVDERMIITFSPNMKAVFIGGVQAEESQLLSLKAEAEFILQSSLWQILYETPKQLAMKAMFVAGESMDDMKKGRSMLYTLDTQKRILETLASTKKVK